MRRVSWNKLPIEILLSVFQRNDDITNSQCSLTCRDWKYAAQCTLFKKIPTLDEKKLDLMSKALSIYQTNRTDFDQSPGNYVKIVDCRLLSEISDWKLIDRLFPFLEVIETNAYMRSGHNEFYKLLKEGNFPHLRVLPTDHFNKPPPELLLARREKIKELKLYSTSLEDEILQKLHLFPNLKMLYLNHQQEVHLENLFSEEIQHLKSIHIMFGIHSRNLETSLVDINNIHPFQNVRGMKINHYQFFYHDDKYMLYLMKKFPNLNSLEITDDRQYFIDGSRHSFATCDYAVPTMNCLFQFLVYLFKMKHSNVICMMTDNFTTQIVKSFLDHVIDQRSVHSKNIELKLKVLFHFVNPEQEHKYHPDRIASIGLKIQKAGYKGYKEDQCILSVMYKVLQEASFQLHLQLFREVGNMGITSLVVTSPTIFSSIPVDLDEVFSTFSKLKDFAFIYVSNFTWNREEYLVEETLNLTIKSMEYTKCALGKDMFPMISKRCQNLKFLYLENCFYFSYDENPVTARYFPIFMKSTCLEELKISLNNNNEFQYKKAFIRLITNSKRPRYCKITTETGSPIVNFSEQDCTETHYNICLYDEECGVFDIHCESVVKLTVEFKTDDCEYLDGYHSYNEEVEEEEGCSYWKQREYNEEYL